MGWGRVYVTQLVERPGTEAGVGDVRGRRNGGEEKVLVRARGNPVNRRSLGRDREDTGDSDVTGVFTLSVNN